MVIYKILLPPEWNEFDAAGEFVGSPLDLTSGFIHCSARAQVESTALRFFADEPALVVLALDTEELSDAVRWEPSPDGDLFPHVYGRLTRRAVLRIDRVPGAAQIGQVLGAS